MTVYPPSLKPGSTIALVANARKVNPNDVTAFIQMAESRGYRIHIPDGLYESHFQQAGSAVHRTQLLQSLLDNPTIQAIWYARGGYGTVHLLDDLNWEGFKRYPKWIVGFSDATALHAACWVNTQTASLHASMATNAPDGPSPHSTTAWAATWKVLEEGRLEYHWTSNEVKRAGEVTGVTLGGNLSVLMSLSGSKTDIALNNSILFLEDLDEYRYHLNRMIYWLTRRNDFPTCNALLGGYFSDMKDLNPDNPFGREAEGMFQERLANTKMPYALGLPFGHEALNMPLIHGGEARLAIEGNNIHLNYYRE